MGNLTEYIEHSRATGSYWQSLVSYYAARIPWFFEACSRIVTLLAAVLTIGLLQRHNEMTALMAAGISRWRIVLPLVAAGVTVSLLAALNRELSLPNVRQALCSSFRDLSSDKGEEMTPLYDYETEVLIDGERIISKTNQIVNPRFELPSNWSSFGRSLRAKTATYSPATSELPVGFLLEDVQTNTRLVELPSYTPHLMSQPSSTNPVVLSPRDFPVLTESQLFLACSLTLEQIQRGRQWQQYSSTMQLIGDLRSRSLDHGTETRVLVHSRFVQPMLDMVLLFLGLPVALSPKNRGLFLSAGKNILVVVLFTVVTLTSHALGVHCLVTPAFAAWLPLLALVPVCVALSRPLQQ